MACLEHNAGVGDDDRSGLVVHVVVVVSDGVIFVLCDVERLCSMQLSQVFLPEGKDRRPC